LKDFRGGDRFADFTYIRGSFRLLIEADDGIGPPAHEKTGCRGNRFRITFRPG